MHAHMSVPMLACSKVEILNPKLRKSFHCTCLMTLTVDLQGHGHILCPLVDYGIQVMGHCTIRLRTASHFSWFLEISLQQVIEDFITAV